MRVRPHMTAVMQGSSHCGHDAQLLVPPPRALACFPPPPRGASVLGSDSGQPLGTAQEKQHEDVVKLVHKRLVVGAHSVHLQESDQLHMSLNRGSSGGALG